MRLPRDCDAAVAVAGKTAVAVGRFAAAAGVVGVIVASVGAAGAAVVGAVAVVGDLRTPDSTDKRLEPNSLAQTPKCGLLVDRHNTPV